MNELCAGKDVDGTVVALQVPFLCQIVPRQQKAAKAVALIRETVEDLVAKCKKIVDEEGERLEGEEYINEADPSVLRFLLASREEVQLRLIIRPIGSIFLFSVSTFPTHTKNNNSSYVASDHLNLLLNWRSVDLTPLRSI